MMCVFSVDSEFVCSFVFVSIGLNKISKSLQGENPFSKTLFKANILLTMENCRTKSEL